MLAEADARTAGVPAFLAVACNTAPGFVNALVAQGATSAGGYTQALGLSLRGNLTDAELAALARRIGDIAVAVAGPDPDREARIFRAHGAAFTAIWPSPGFMLLHFVDQLREAPFVAT